MTNTNTNVILAATILEARITLWAKQEITSSEFVAMYVADGSTQAEAVEALNTGIGAINAAIAKCEHAAKLARLRAVVAANREAGRQCYTGLKSHEIGTLSGATMFGDHGEAAEGMTDAEWSRIVD